MNRALFIAVALLSITGSSFAQSLFFGGSGNFVPHGSGNVFVGISSKSGAVVMNHYGQNIFSLDLVVYKYQGLVISFGGRLSNRRENDFVSVLLTPELHEVGKWKLFGKAGLNADIGSGTEMNKRFSPIFGMGLRFN